MKPTSGLRWVPKAAVYMRWILQCVGLWQWPRVQLEMSESFFGIEHHRKSHGLPACPQRFLPLCNSCKSNLHMFCLAVFLEIANMRVTMLASS